MMSNEEQDGSVAKKLRCAEPDLRVIVGQDEDKKEYRYYYQVLASHSNYIDTMLASPMRESQTMEVKFPDLTPDTWESLIGFLTDSVKAVDMTLADTIKVIVGYNQYDFRGGCQLCDRIMTEFFEKNEEFAGHGEKPDDELNSLIDAYILADQIHLEKAKSAGTKYFSFVLNSSDRFKRNMFTEPRIEKLVPLIAEEDLLQGAYKKEDILSPLFSKYLVAMFRNWQTNCDLEWAVPKLSLSGTYCNADGDFYRTSRDCFTCQRRVHFSDADLFTIKIEILDDEWVIYGETAPETGEGGVSQKKFLWKCRCSENLPLPPKIGWEHMHGQLKGDPFIVYLCENSYYHRCGARETQPCS